MKKRLLPLLFIALPLMAAETGYRIVHPDGTVEFTDDPTLGGEPIELREAPTYRHTPPTSSGESRSKGPAKAEKEDSSEGDDGYQTLRITSPGDEQTLWFDGQGMSVSLQITPSLKSGDEVVIELDGEEVARGRSTGYTLKDVYRGSHTLHARIEDSDGNIRMDSESITFHMRQHSVN
ncbi:MAG: hypothetical protein ACQETD_00795 [Pseudomonadota bacterium]